MMKKKNVAMAMAATMMASAVAPVVVNAAEVEKHEINSNQNAQLIKEITKLLKQTYIEDGEALEDSLYTVEVTSGNTTVTATTLTDIPTIEQALKIAKENSTNATVTVYENSKTVQADGDIIDKQVKTYEDANQLFAGYNSMKTSGAAMGLNKAAVDNNDIIFNAKTGKIEVKITANFTSNDFTSTSACLEKVNEINDLEINGIDITAKATSTGGSTSCATVTASTIVEIQVGDEKVKNLDNVVDKSGKTLVLAEMLNDISKTTDACVESVKDLGKKLASIEKFESIDAEKFMTKIAEVTVYPEIRLEKLEAKELLDNGILTKEGQELLDSIGSTYEKTSEDNKTTTYTIKAEAGSIGYTTVNGVKTYSVDVEINGKNDGEVDKLAKLTITSTSKSDLQALVDAISDTNTYGFGKAKVVNELSGDTRFETAIEISEKTVDGERNAVVLVGENAVVDGLAAGPLAAQLDTSILLTGKDSVKANVVSEIERVLDVENSTKAELKNKTIYLVGGVNVISESVVEQLSQLGVKVQRLAGDTRYETSMEIAKEIAKKAPAGKTASTKAYVVGGDGLADAMSISAVASQKDSVSKVVSPIIVVNKDSIDTDTLETIVDDYTELDIIGGTAVVSEDVEAQLVDELGSKKVVRVKGETREETNAAVINKYFSTGNDKIFVTNNGFVSGINTKGNDQLIDAMTVAPLAGKLNAPIVLTGNELSESQEEALEIRTASKASVTKVGGAVVQSVIQAVAKLAGISK